MFVIHPDVFQNRMSLVSDFDEDDSSVTIPLSHSIAKVAEYVFAPTIEIDEKKLTRCCKSALELTDKELLALLNLLDECIGDFYVKHKGHDWNQLKADEMLDPALVYVWYNDGPDLACFVSFRMVNELYGKSLYLYEIHVKPLYQMNQIGSKLISAFHSLASYLNVLVDEHSGDSVKKGFADDKNNILINSDLLRDLQGLPQRKHFGVSGTGLTVFSDNTRALTWYLGLGYLFASDSPLDRTLRRGVIKKPEYYILYRPTSM